MPIDLDRAVGAEAVGIRGVQDGVGTGSEACEGWTVAGEHRVVVEGPSEMQGEPAAGPAA